jgi:flotillin
MFENFLALIPAEFGPFLPIIIVVALILIGLATFRATYNVVPPHEAHVVVSRGKGLNLYSSRQTFKSSYFYVPWLMKRTILPLRNKQLFIDDIPLRDSKLAKFVCDVVCWINIEEPRRAAERIGEQARIRDFAGIEDDIKNLVKSVTRNSSMKMDLVKIMSERLIFSQEVEDEIKENIVEWGMRIVDLECIHFVDIEPYTVISDLEKRQSAVINSTTRQLVAVKEKEANIAESDAKRETELTVAKNEEAYMKRQLERDEEVGKREQEKDMTIAKAKEDANKQEVEAKRALDVGTADVVKQATITKAEGEAGATERRGEATASVTKMTGTAEADVVEAKMTAEATGIDRKATAQKKYETPQALTIEMFGKIIDGYVEIQKSMFTNFGPALKEANIRVISTGEEGTFLGLPVGARGGIQLGGMLEGLKETTGVDFTEMLKGAAKSLKETLLPEEKTEKTKKKKERGE